VAVTFTAGSGIPPALAITKSHTGNFTQGQQNATYEWSECRANQRDDYGDGHDSGRVDASVHGGNRLGVCSEHLYEQHCIRGGREFDDYGNGECGEQRSSICDECGERVGRRICGS
jgi:hypothetical protein